MLKLTRASCQSVSSMAIDNPSQAEQVRQRGDQQLKGFLQLHDVALAARHDASDRGPMKEGRGQGLQMIEQLRA